MKYVMFYELAGDGMAKVPTHMPSHQARLAAFHARGVLLMAGPFGSPPVGAMSIYTSREAAEEFAAGDAFVQHGIVSKYTIHEWNEVFSK